MHFFCGPTSGSCPSSKSWLIWCGTPLSLNSLKWFSHINDRCWAQIINCNHHNKYTKFTSKNQILLTKKIKLTFYSLLFITCCWKIAFVPFLYNSHLLPGGVNPPLKPATCLPRFPCSLTGNSLVWQTRVSLVLSVERCWAHEFSFNCV